MIQRILLSLLLLPTFALAQQVSKPASKPDTTAASETGAPKVVFTTSVGDFTVELYPDKAPKTVENFLEYVNSGFYDGTAFHRVVDNFMVQAGGFTAELKHKPTRPAIANEANNGLSNLRGTLAMARTMDPHSATAQFFINVVDNPRIDYSGDQNAQTWGYCVFGKIISGMDVIDKIKALPTGAMGPFLSEVPTPLPVIEKATVMKPGMPDSAMSNSDKDKASVKPKASKSPAKTTNEKPAAKKTGG
ncbi:MAG: peptidylprolyl isomerase [Dokdonella sp.]